MFYNRVPPDNRCNIPVRDQSRRLNTSGTGWRSPVAYFPYPVDTPNGRGDDPPVHSRKWALAETYQLTLLLACQFNR